MIASLRYCTSESCSFQLDIDGKIDGGSLSGIPVTAKFEVDAVDGFGC